MARSADMVRYYIVIDDALKQGTFECAATWIINFFYKK